MQGKVQVGLATVTGYSVSTVAFVGAVLAYLGGDHSDQTVAIIGCGIVGALAFLVTNIGRYRQATAITKYGPYIVPCTLEDKAVAEVDHDSAADPEGPGDPLPDDLAAVPAPDGPVTDVGDGEAAPA